MAVGDVTAAAVRPSGWEIDVTIEGWVGDAGSIAYDFGLDGENRATAATPRLTLTGPGYSSQATPTSVDRTVYLTKAVRLPHPDQQILNETASGADLVVRVALSSYVHVGDTGLVASFPDGWATNAGTAAGPTAATPSVSVANGSTEGYGNVIGQWDHVAGVATADTVTGDFKAAFNAAHRRGVACVRLTATGKTSSHSQSFTVGSPSKALRRSGRYGYAYEGTFSIDGFDQGELIDLRAEAFPASGDAASVLDTDENTDIDVVARGYNRATILCDKNSTTARYAYVDPAGSDSTGVVDASATTAAASPFATILAALAADSSAATRVRLLAGTHTLSGPIGPTTGNTWRTVEAAPGVGRSSAVISIPASATFNYSTSYFLVRGVTVTAATNAYFAGGNGDRVLRFVDCDMTRDGTTVTGHGYRSAGTFIENCVLPDGEPLREIGVTSKTRYAIDGCTGHDLGLVAHRVVACAFTGDTGLQPPAQALNPPIDNFYMLNTSMLGRTGFGSAVKFASGSGRDLNDAAIIGCILETAQEEGQPLVEISGSSSRTLTANVLLWGNTFVGNRLQLGYNDIGSSATPQRLWSVRFNSWSNFNVKSDLFGTPDGARVGNWAVVHGVDWFNNLYETTASFSAGGSSNLGFDGLGTRYLGVGNAGYIDDASAPIGDGSANGDYTPAEGSPLRTEPAPEPRPFVDLNGVTRAASGIGAIAIGTTVGEVSADAFTSRPWVLGWPWSAAFGVARRLRIGARRAMRARFATSRNPMRRAG